MRQSLALPFVLLAIVIGSLLGIQMMIRWDFPPIQTTQNGPDGLAMGDVQNPRRLAKKAAANEVPPSVEKATPSGTKASATYENVQVLGDLDTEEFNRLMASITEWVAPDQGCTYCHNAENLADDTVYTKVVARRMLQMTKHINSTYQDHVKQTGVTCYTCHRGQPVPNGVWFANDGLKQASGAAASRNGQNLASAVVGSTSLPYDPFSELFAKDAQIRVIPKAALPGTATADIHATEKTYGLMMYMSQSMGVNCTFCHNSRSFSVWAESTPQRVTAWHGIKMVADVNADYVTPLQPVFPPHRLGPKGDVAKVGCATCHQGVNKPLLGVSMLKDYPELAIPN